MQDLTQNELYKLLDYISEQKSRFIRNAQSLERMQTKQTDLALCDLFAEIINSEILERQQQFIKQNFNKRSK